MKTTDYGHGCSKREWAEEVMMTILFFKYLPIQSDKLAHKVTMKKKITKRQSTMQIPCVNFEHKTCQSIEDFKLILHNLKCIIPFLQVGNHLTQFYEKDMENCSHDATRKAFGTICN